jgi:hypothetical protein
MKFAALPVLSCLLLTLTCAGCGQSVDLGAPVKVTGTATLDGTPLDKTTVGFTAISKGLPAKYRYVSAITDASGNFSIAQVYPAEYSVTLNQDASAAPAAQDAAVPGNPKLAKYTVNSPLKANVSKDSTTFKFEATSGR